MNGGRDDAAISNAFRNNQVDGTPAALFVRQRAVVKGLGAKIAVQREAKSLQYGKNLPLGLRIADSGRMSGPCDNGGADGYGLSMRDGKIGTSLDAVTDGMS